MRTKFVLVEEVEAVEIHEMFGRAVYGCLTCALCSFMASATGLPF